MSYKGSSSQQEEKVMLARDEKDQMYEPKPNKKVIRILTVAAYVFCVSLAAIILSLYYVFFWEGSQVNKNVTVKPTAGCGHFLQNSEQVSESEFRKITGIEKKVQVNPSLGPSIPTAVFVSKDRVFDVKEIKMEQKQQPQEQQIDDPGDEFLGVQPLLFLPKKNSTTDEDTVDKKTINENLQNDDADYQGDETDEEDEFESDEESSGQGGVDDKDEYSVQTGGGQNNSMTNEEQQLNGNEI